MVLIEYYVYLLSWVSYSDEILEAYYMVKEEVSQSFMLLEVQGPHRTVYFLVNYIQVMWYGFISPHSKVIAYVFINNFNGSSLLSGFYFSIYISKV